MTKDDGGKYYDVCPTCAGRRKVYVYAYKTPIASDPFPMKLVECPDCKSKGYILNQAGETFAALLGIEVPYKRFEIDGNLRGLNIIADYNGTVYFSEPTGGEN